MRIQTRPLSIHLFFFFLTLVQSFPKLLKTNKRSKRRNKKAKGCFVLFLFSVAYKFEELMRIFLWCGLEFLVWAYTQIKVQTAIYFTGMHEILTRMPLNSFSWSICWAFGAKCSWQNFVMVCLSWEKRWGEMHTLHPINILSSSSLGYFQCSPDRQSNDLKPRSARS